MPKAATCTSCSTTSSPAGFIWCALTTAPTRPLTAQPNPTRPRLSCRQDLDAKACDLTQAAAAADRVTVAAIDVIKELAAPSTAPSEAVQVEVVTLKCVREGRLSRHVLLKPYVLTRDVVTTDTDTCESPS